MTFNRVDTVFQDPNIPGASHTANDTVWGTVNGVGPIAMTMTVAARGLTGLVGIPYTDFGHAPSYDGGGDFGVILGGALNGDGDMAGATTDIRTNQVSVVIHLGSGGLIQPGGDTGHWNLDFNIGPAPDSSTATFVANADTFLRVTSVGVAGSTWTTVLDIDPVAGSGISEITLRRNTGEADFDWVYAPDAFTFAAPPLPPGPSITGALGLERGRVRSGPRTRQTSGGVILA